MGYNSNMGQNLKTKYKAKASAGAIKKKQTKEIKPYSTKDEILFLEPEKIETLNLPTKKNNLIGAKGTGKTFPVITRAVGHMEEDRSANVAIGKKYKTNAMDKLSRSISNVVIGMKFKGFDIPQYKQSINRTIRIGGFDPSEQQSIEYFSFEDTNGVAGIEAMNIGYFSDVIFEEVIEQNDSKNIPDKQEWDKIVATVEDSIGRWTLKYIEVTGKIPPETKYWFTMNPWDDHPILDRAEIVHPENKFLEWVLKDIFNNHTQTAIDMKNSESFTRTQKMANPITRGYELFFYENDIQHYEQFAEREDEMRELLGAKFNAFELYIKKEVTTIYQRIQLALESNDKFELAILLGMKDTSGSNVKSYNLDNWQVKTEDDIWNPEKTEIKGQSVSWDIDQRRQMIGGSTVLFFDKEQNRHRVWIDKDIVVKCYGDGFLGDNIKNYSRDLKAETLNELNKYYLKGAKNLEFGKYIYLDDDKSHYLQAFLDVPMHDVVIGKAKKHGKWAIVPRQDWMNMAIESGFICFHPDLIQLKKDMAKSVRKIGQEQRDESGKLEENYDRINRIEYGIFPFRNFLYNFGEENN